MAAAPPMQSGIDNSGLCESGSTRQFQFTISVSLLRDRTKSKAYRFALVIRGGGGGAPSSPSTSSINSPCCRGVPLHCTHGTQPAAKMARSSSATGSWARRFPCCCDGDRRNRFGGRSLSGDLLPPPPSLSAMAQQPPRLRKKNLVSPYDPRYKYAF